MSGSKRIPAIPTVCKLDRAITPGIYRGHNHYVAFPVEPGVQPCLIETTAFSGAVTVDDCLVVLPNDAPHLGPEEHPNYGNYLSLVQYELRNDIEELQGRADIVSAANTCHMRPPFRSDEQTTLIKAVRKFLRSARTDSTPDLRHAASQLEDKLNQTDVWFVDPKFLRVVQNRRPENWVVIEHWPSWEARKLRLFDRFIEFCELVHRPVPSTRAAFESEMKGFNQRFLFLRLKLSIRSKRRALHREWAQRGWPIKKR